ncbi:aminoglycoside phosphotransferase family protein [Streptomyces sp. T-3]|nr:aminoglycoside phosphotransferase family protein [Streptomyces sp. T-3]
MTATRPGGFTSRELHTVLRNACWIAGLDARGAALVRGQTSAVFRLSSHPVLVKIAPRGTRTDRVRHTVDFVRWLTGAGFPTVSLYAETRQPIVVEGHAVTLWDYLPQPDHPVPAESLAKPLKALHRLHGPPIPLRRLDAVAAIRSSLARTANVPVADLALLEVEADRLEVALAGVTYELPEGVLHGDPQHGNALHGAAEAVLCDWDSVAIGPPEWDLVTVEVHCRRFGYDRQHYQRFADAYGWDVARWSGYPVLRDLRELRMITTNARKATHNPHTLPEVLRRISALRQANREHRWCIL